LGEKTRLFFVYELRRTGKGYAGEKRQYDGLIIKDKIETYD